MDDDELLYFWCHSEECGHYGALTVKGARSHEREYHKGEGQMYALGTEAFILK